MSREMKQSGIPWIGEIPKEWSILQLKRLKDKSHPYPIGDGDHGSIKPEDYIDEGIPYIRVQNMTWGGDLLLDNIAYISEEVNDRNLKSELHPKDILIAKTGATIGKTAIIPDSMPKANTTSSVAKVTISKQQWYKYVFYVLGSDVCITQMWLKAQQKSAQPGFNIDELVDFILPLPSLPEQQKIASFLDRKCAEIDEMIALQEKIVEELKAYKQSVITEAVTKGLNPDVPMKESGIEWIGEIPEHWTVCRIKNAADLFGRIGFRGYTSDDLNKDGIGAITLSPSNMLPMGMDYSSVTYLSWMKYEESPEIKIRNGDILMVKTGSSYGKVSYVESLPREATINPQILRIVAHSGSKHLAYFLQTPLFLYQVEGGVVGGTIPTISQEKINNFIILMPPLSEREEISDYLDTKCTEIDNLISIKLSKIDSLKEYKKSIIYEYVTGKKEVTE